MWKSDLQHFTEYKNWSNMMVFRTLIPHFCPYLHSNISRREILLEFSLVADIPPHEAHKIYLSRSIIIQQTKCLARGTMYKHMGCIPIASFVECKCISTAFSASFQLTKFIKHLALGKMHHHTDRRIEVSRQQAWLKWMRGTPGKCNQGPKGP